MWSSNLGDPRDHLRPPRSRFLYGPRVICKADFRSFPLMLLKSFRTRRFYQKTRRSCSMPNEHVPATQLPQLPDFTSSLTLAETPSIHYGTQVRARAWVSPALLELDQAPAASWRRPMHVTNAEAQPSGESLDRYITAYKAMALQAEQGLGIPKAAMPTLAANPTISEIQVARNHLELMIQSFLSASL